MSILKNPITIWIKSFCEIIYYTTLKFPKNALSVGYMSRLSNCNFGHFNSLADYVIMTNVSISDYSYIAKGAQISNATIGKFCSLGPEILIGVGKHPTREYMSTHPVFYSIKPPIDIVPAPQKVFNEYEDVTIGNDVWIGARAIVLDGVSIGDGAIIGAGALVNKDVPPYAVFAGVPAKLVRFRFNEKEIEFLMKLKWWHRNLSWIVENMRLFSHPEQILDSFNSIQD